MDALRARELLLSRNGVTEHDHFGKAAYRGITNKGKPSRIFLTLWIEDNRAVLLLDMELQAELHARQPLIFFPVPNKWGAKGATLVELEVCNEGSFMEGVRLAMGLAGCG